MSRAKEARSEARSDRRSDSKLEELKYEYYNELRDKKVRIRRTGKFLLCPFCPDQRREYEFHELVRHSYRIGRESKSATFRDKAQHLGLHKYLQRLEDTAEKPYEPKSSYREREDNCKDAETTSSRPLRKTEPLMNNETNTNEMRSRNDGKEIYDLIEDVALPAEKPESVKTDLNFTVKPVESSVKFTAPCLPLGSHVASCEPSSSQAKDELIVWPLMAVVANIPVEYHNGKYVGESGTKLRDKLVAKGHHLVKVHPLWNYRGFSGFAIVEFENSWVGFTNAMKFEKDFEIDRHGKRDWETKRQKGDKLYAWVAREEEFKARGIIGEYLRKHGDLKTISGKQREDERKDTKLMSNLANELEVKSKKCKEMERKISRTEVLLRNVMKQKEDMIEGYNEGMHL